VDVPGAGGESRGLEKAMQASSETSPIDAREMAKSATQDMYGSTKEAGEAAVEASKQATQVIVLHGHSCG
jgi:hypothetical protein